MKERSVPLSPEGEKTDELSCGGVVSSNLKTSVSSARAASSRQRKGVGYFTITKSPSTKPTAICCTLKSLILFSATISLRISVYRLGFLSELK